MEDLRIMANNLDQESEIIAMFIDIGYKRDLFLSCDNDDLMGIHVYSSGEIQDVLDDDYNDKRHKEITIQQLRDLVVLKRNDVGDATHRDSNNYDWYVASDEKHYRMQGDIWVHQPYVGCLELKPIEKEMKIKEYLDPSKNYELCLSSEDLISEGMIEVPDGSEKLLFSAINNNHKHFVSSDNKLMSVEDIENGNGYWYGNAQEYICSVYPSVIWQRSEKENTKQPTGIEATLAERQATYGCFEDVARTTEQIMEALGDHRVNGLNELPYPHRMALYMIASKMSRIVNGDFNHKDSWHDISGYAKLVEDLL